MKQFAQGLILYLLIFSASFTKAFGQCTPNTIEFKGVDKIYNTACGDVSYQVITGSTPTGTGLTYRWEVSFKGENYTIIKDGSNNNISTQELAKSDITNFIIVAHSNASGDYRIRRVVTSSSGCSSSSEPVFLYYAQSSASLSGGTVSGSSPTCAPATGTLTLSGHTGPVLRWERAPAGTQNWELIYSNTTNTYTYENLTESYCYRALVDNICDKLGADMYSTTFCVTVNSLPFVSSPVSQTACLGSTLTLSVTANSVLTPFYQWRKDGINISGAISETYNIPTVVSSDAGSYDVVVSNACGSVTSAPATITVSPLPTVNVPGSSTVCTGAVIASSAFSSNPAGATYSWTNSNTAIGLAASGTGNVPVFTTTNSSTSTISSTITVTPILNGCIGPSSSYTITVNPLPVATVPVNTTVCAGATIPSVSFSSSPTGATFTWTNSNTGIGLSVTGGNGNVPSFTAINNTSSPVSTTITVTPVLNGCTGPSSSYTIMVNPLPVITSVSSTAESYCDARDGTITIVASGAAPLEYSINGGSTFFQNIFFENLPAGSYSVAVRSASGCVVLGNPISVTSPGAPPVPTINPYINPVCQGMPFLLSVVNPEQGVTYTWTGPGGYTATGATVTRTNADPTMTGTYAVTAKIGSCVSGALVFSLTVNPLPAVTVPASLTYCEGSGVPEALFTSTPSGATYTWTNSNTGIGLTGSGTGNVPVFTAINNTSSAITSTITVTPTLNDCVGPSSTYTITINPQPEVIVPANFTVCAGSPVSGSNFSSVPAGATYTWTNSNTTIGLPGSGSGNVPAFTAINTSASVATATITVTPFLNGCNGPSISYVITVNPLPRVDALTNLIVCSGATIAASAFSSTPGGATYTWTNSNTSIGLAGSGSGNIASFTAINSSTYVVTAAITVTPTLNGCTGPSSSYTITVNPLPRVNALANVTVCSGATITATNFSSQPAGASYSWTNSNTSIGLAASGTGNVPSFTASNTSGSPVTATITVTPVLNGCSGPSSSYTILINPLPAIISATVTNESVCDAGDGIINIVATGSAPLEYSINGGSTYIQNGGNFTGLAAGSYSVVVRNSTGCIFIGPTLSVASPGAPPVPSINPYISPVCEGSDLILSIQNVDPLVTYTWTGPLGFTATGEYVTRQNADLSMSGNYAVTATIGSCVSAARVFALIVNPLPTITVPGNVTYCEGSSVPLSILTSTPAGATFTWTNSNTNIGLAAGGSGDVPSFTTINNATSPISATITVTPTLNGCSGPSSSYTITVNPLPEVSVPANITMCTGTPISASSFSSIPAGATYTWTNSNNTIGLPASGSGNVPAFTAVNPSTAVQSATITITPLLNGCAGPSSSYTITVNPLPTVSVPTNSTLCSGTGVSATNFNSIPAGANYTWINSNPAIGLPSSGSGNVPAFTVTNTSNAVISGTITVTPTLNGCTGPSSTYTITVNPLPVVTVPANSTVCSGTTIPSFSFSSVPPGATYTWTNSNTAIGLAASGSGNVPSFTAINNTGSPFTATITVSLLLNGCVGPPTSYTILVNPLPAIISASAIGESFCNADDGSITIYATGTAPLEYSINGGASFIRNGGNFTGLAAGSYSVAVRNSTGCIILGPTLSVSSPGAPPTPRINPYTSPICQGSPLVLSIQNPDPMVTYIWTGPLGFTFTGPSVIRPNADLSMSGTYAVNAAIGSCVSASRIFSLAVSPLPVATVPVSLTYCPGSTVPEGNLSSTPAGANYTWKNSNPEIGLISSGSGNVPGFIAVNSSSLPITATITVTPWLNGCAGPSSSYTITINPLPQVDIPVNSAVCPGTYVSATSFSSIPVGATYTWTNSNPAIGLPANGNGDVPGFTAQNNNIYPLSAIITVTPVLNGCTGPPSSYTITVNPLPQVSNLSLTQAICSGSNSNEVTLNSNIQGTTFSWTAMASSYIEGFTAKGTGTIPVQFLTNTSSSAGTISYLITPFLNGCAGPSSEYTIVVNPLPTAVLSGSTTACYGGTTTLNVNLTGTAPWIITYTDDITPVTISGINTNRYSFNVTSNTTKTYTIISVSDGLSCNGKGSGSAIVIQPARPVNATAASSNINCYGANNGILKVQTSVGGFGTYEYSINEGQSWQRSTTFTGLAPGTYVLQVRDAEHPECITVVSSSYRITQPSAPISITSTKSDATCFDGRNGSIQLTTTTGGTAPYTYKWSNGLLSKDIIGLMAGNYTVTITDAKGCVLNETITIKQPSAGLDIYYTKTDVSCFGNQDASINITVTGGTAPYSYTWSNQERTEDIRNLASGSYMVIVVDAKGCTANQNITINQPDALKASLTVKSTSCKTTIDGVITAAISGGTEPYTMSWTGLPQTGNIINGLPPGTYQFQVRDAKGCTVTVSAELVAGNCPPVAVNDRYRTDEEVAISGTVASNDFDQQQEMISFALVSQPKNGKITFTPDGNFTYTPNVGFWQTETVTYKVCNTSGLCATATLYIDVIPNTLVYLTPALSNVREGKKVTVTARLMRPFRDDVIARISFTGRAGKEKDYVLLDQYLDIRIPRGKVSTTEKITVAALTDNILEGDEDVILTISATSDPLVRIGNGAVVIINDVYPPDTLSNPVNTQIPLNPDILPDPLLSPNGDGQGNELFVIENLVSFPDNLVLIFNRWGNEVFRMKGYNESDRVFRGFANTGLMTNTNTPLADGVYYFLITTNRIVSGKNVSALNKGYLILKR